MNLSERLARFDRPDLYVVITEAFCGGRSALDVLDAVLDAGVRLIQFREKDLDELELFLRATQFRERTRKYDALLIINDRLEVAIATDADGVHLGQTDAPVDVARRIVPELIIGASTHNLEEALEAQALGASYVNIGPIFATQTKAVPTGVVGPAMIDAIAPHLTIPWTTMGGIKLHNIDEVLKRGAKRVAVVTAVTEADDVRAAASELRERILSFHA
ncbi:MAG: thiamine phosphate synthase [Candidatus Hydrogenedentes bacterium]|nr:thiamine phosphate synthase [Candidatus Hydrogenedentota bacterium]